jgi:hypothetical protein
LRLGCRTRLWLGCGPGLRLGCRARLRLWRGAGLRLRHGTRLRLGLRPELAFGLLPGVLPHLRLGPRLGGRPLVLGWRRWRGPLRLRLSWLGLGRLVPRLHGGGLRLGLEGSRLLLHRAWTPLALGLDGRCLLRLAGAKLGLGGRLSRGWRPGGPRLVWSLTLGLRLALAEVSVARTRQTSPRRPR